MRGDWQSAGAHGTACDEIPSLGETGGSERKHSLCGRRAQALPSGWPQPTGEISSKPPGDIAKPGRRPFFISCGAPVLASAFRRLVASRQETCFRASPNATLPGNRSPAAHRTGQRRTLSAACSLTLLRAPVAGNPLETS